MSRLQLTIADIALLEEALEHRASRLDSMAKVSATNRAVLQNAKKADEMRALSKRFLHAPGRKELVVPVEVETT